jgi:hypothetical protein
MRLGHHHQSQIVRRRVRVGQGLGANMVIYQESSVARRHCSFLHLENLAGRLVESVVEDTMHVVCTRSCG